MSRVAVPPSSQSPHVLDKIGELLAQFFDLFVEQPDFHIGVGIRLVRCCGFDHLPILDGEATICIPSSRGLLAE